MKKGFTFIELLVTVTIIIIISTGAIMSFSSATKKARDNRRRTDLERIRTALELYRQEMGGYPSGNAAISSTTVAKGYVPANGLTGAGIIKVNGSGFIDTLPIDPSFSSLGTIYYYDRSASQYSYVLAGCFEVEAASGSGASGLSCPTGAPNKIVLSNP